MNLSKYIFGIFFLISNLLLAQPEISHIEGDYILDDSFIEGSRIRIHGSNFGNGPQLILFDDFENGTPNEPIQTGSNSARIGNWNAIEGTVSYTDYSAVSGSLAFSADMNSYWRNLVEVLLPSNTRKVFISWWLFLPADNNYPGELSSDKINWKQMWIQGAGTTDDDLIVPVFLEGSKLFDGNDAPYTNYTTVNFRKGVWKKLWVFIYGGYNSDGICNFWELDNDGPIQRENDISATILDEGGLFERVHVNGYGRATPNCHPMFDDVYVAVGDNAQVRVEIGDNNNYDNCKNLATVPALSWNNDQIEIDLLFGNLNGVSDFYLFITDMNGDVNMSGYHVSTGITDNSPTPPSNIKITR